LPSFFGRVSEGLSISSGLGVEKLDQSVGASGKKMPIFRVPGSGVPGIFLSKTPRQNDWDCWRIIVGVSPIFHGKIRRPYYLLDENIG
jgi:hypothetical protein